MRVSEVCADPYAAKDGGVPSGGVPSGVPSGVPKRGLARRELARRALARRRLVDFARYTYSGYEAAAVHELLAEYLEAVARYVETRGREGIGRLMVFMPPRHGKSELVSVRFPAWFLGRLPDKRVILSSCTGDLAVSFARQVRNVIADVPYRNLFGASGGRDTGEAVELAEDSRAANAWNLAGHRGGLTAAGVGGAIIGRGAHLGIIDDPFKDRNEAESQAVRDRVDDWYRSTFYTRLEDGGAVVLMHQRWHTDDLAGRLLRRMVEEEGADQWTVLCLGAVAEEKGFNAETPRSKDAPREMQQGRKAQRRNGAKEEQREGESFLAGLRDGLWLGADALGREAGEPLWPEKYPVEALALIRSNIGGYEWDALYQQRPRRIEGAVIKAHLIKIVGSAPDFVSEVRYWDLAVSKKERADYLVGARLGRTKMGHVYIVDVMRLPGPWADARPRIEDVMLRDGPGVVQGVEVAGQQEGYLQEWQRSQRLQGLAIRGVNPQRIGNKMVRANVWASRIEDGLIHMVRASWNDGFVAECVAFPQGQHDDQVDGVSGAVQMLGMGGGWVRGPVG